MRRRFRTQSEEDSLDEPIINLTPLIDVVFVVLITFMLIAPVLDIDLVDLAPAGPASKGTTPQSSPLTLSVHADNTIWIGGKEIPLSQLDKRLREEKKLHPTTTPQLLHDSKASFGTYQAIKNTMEAVGFAQMDVILKPGK